MSSAKAIVMLSLICVALVCADKASKSTSSSTLGAIEETLKDYLKTDGKQGTGRSYTPGSPGSPIDPNYMNQILAQKPIELFHLLPIILIPLLLIPLVLPIIFQLFAGLLGPIGFPHGRRKRDTTHHQNPHLSQVLMDLLAKYGDSLDKYNQL